MSQQPPLNEPLIRALGLVGLDTLGNRGTVDFVVRFERAAKGAVATCRVYSILASRRSSCSIATGATSQTASSATRA
jgi:hypothetical protein